MSERERKKEWPFEALAYWLGSGTHTVQLSTSLRKIDHGKTHRGLSQLGCYLFVIFVSVTTNAPAEETNLPPCIRSRQRRLYSCFRPRHMAYAYVEHAVWFIRHREIEKGLLQKIGRLQE